MKKVLLTATVQSHIAQFHLPLIRMLKENGYEVHVAAKNNLAEKNGLRLDLPDKIFDVGFDRSPFSLRNIKAYYQLKKIIKKYNYDVIHCNTPIGGLITRLVARFARKKGTKIFYTAHGFHFYEGAPLLNWVFYYPIEKWLARYTDKLITITKEDYKLASKKFNTNVYLIPGVGANSNKFYPYSKSEISKTKKELGYKEDQFILLCVGELNKNKNQKTVIKVTAELVKDFPKIKLLLAGNGPEKDKLRKLVNKLNLEKHVDFLGYRTDLERYINICDILISASYREGLPLNIMEAMLCRKPVIASLNRGHKELIKDRVTGLIVGSNDIAAFVNLIMRLIRDEELRQRLGENASKFIEPYKDIKVIQQLQYIYELSPYSDCYKH